MYWTDEEIDSVTIRILQGNKNMKGLEKLRGLVEAETNFPSLLVVDESIMRIARKDEKSGFWQIKPEVLKRLEEQKRASEASKT